MEKACCIRSSVTRALPDKAATQREKSTKPSPLASTLLQMVYNCASACLYMRSGVTESCPAPNKASSLSSVNSPRAGLDVKALGSRGTVSRLEDGFTCRFDPPDPNLLRLSANSFFAFERRFKPERDFCFGMAAGAYGNGQCSGVGGSLRSDSSCCSQTTRIRASFFTVSLPRAKTWMSSKVSPAKVSCPASALRAIADRKMRCKVGLALHASSASTIRCAKACAGTRLGGVSSCTAPADKPLAGDGSLCDRTHS
mmetsp:Transcript_25642/g.65903  ORF Transcript_25642/g.65903 Transcript_25642/m.65903 type:complete len:255 (-) Transcript_25642:1459-2223(-)